MKATAFAVVPRPEKPAVESPYLDTREAMAYLRVKHLQQLYALINEHGLPALRCGGRYRFDKRELDAWLRGTTAIELSRSRRKTR